MIFNVTGGGGAALNFKVLTYPTNEERSKAKPPTNTIGIVTTTPMTSWIFSVEEPSPSEPGMVWISIGTSSEFAFNALKKNTVMVYPISAKQCINSKWIDVSTQSYQDGIWVDWVKNIYLFKSGEGKVVAFTSTKQDNCSITETNDSITIKLSYGTYNTCVWLTSAKVSLANAKKLVFRAKCNPLAVSDDMYVACFYILTGVPNFDTWGEITGQTVRKIPCTPDAEAREYSIMVDDLNGSYYIGTAGCHSDTTIYDIYYTE